MTIDPRWKLARELAERALDIPEPERATWLSNACGDDDGLLRLCSELLASFRDDDTMFLESPLHDVGHGSPDAPALEGTTLADLEVGEQIGVGGMATVHRALEKRLDREVAIKFLRGGGACQQADIDRFKREARAASRLCHPGIVPVFAVGQEGDLHWFTMELVPGRDLGAELDALRHADAPNEAPRIPGPGVPGHSSVIARLVADVAEALHHAHEHGVVHRDVKPANLLLQDDLRIRITDFGIARTEGLGHLTQTGFAAGTAYYMSPEQIAADDIDHRTDIYSLGVVLYELATLQRPFEGRTAEIVRDRIRSLDPTPPRRVNPRLPRDLETICLKALHKNPAERYATAMALAVDLRRFLNHEAIEARPTGPFRRALRWTRRRTGTIGAIAATLVITAGAMAWHRAADEREDNEQLAREAIELANGANDSPNPFKQRIEARGALDRVDFDRLDGALRERAALARLAVARPETSTIDTEFQAVRELIATLIGDAIPGATEAAGLGLQRLAEYLAEVENPDPDQVNGLSAVLRPRLQVVPGPGDPRDARIEVRRYLDTTTLPEPEPSLVATLDGSLQSLAPGLYRISVIAPGRTRRDFQRVLQVATDTRILLGESTTPDTSRMVEIPADVLDLDALVGTAGMLDADRVAVGRFLIDPAEVSVAEFRAFCRATGRKPNDRFLELETDPANQDRPATLVTFEEARAYAEWQGKRLPTLPEFWAAVMYRSTTEGYVPSGFEGRAFAPNWDRDRAPRGTPRMLVLDWQANTVPVLGESSSDADTARNAAGIWHLLGNVSEWTESTYGYFNDGQRRLVLGSRLATGGSWRTALADGALEPIEEVRIGPQSPRVSVGFRCVLPLDD